MRITAAGAYVCCQSESILCLFSVTKFLSQEALVFLVPRPKYFISSEGFPTRKKKVIVEHNPRLILKAEKNNMWVADQSPGTKRGLENGN